MSQCLAHIFNYAWVNIEPLRIRMEKNSGKDPLLFTDRSAI